MTTCHFLALLLLGTIRCPAQTDDTGAFAPAHSEFELSFPASEQDRRTLPNGTVFLLIHGTITNVTRNPAKAPPLRILLRDSEEKVVFVYDVAPLPEMLKPGESVTINEAVTEVPKSAKVAEIGWKPE